MYEVSLNDLSYRIIILSLKHHREKSVVEVNQIDFCVINYLEWYNIQLFYFSIPCLFDELGDILKETTPSPVFFMTSITFASIKLLAEEIIIPWLVAHHLLDISTGQYACHF